jgi:hypothetical protein
LADDQYKVFAGNHVTQTTACGVDTHVTLAQTLLAIHLHLFTADSSQRRSSELMSEHRMDGTRYWE